MAQRSVESEVTGKVWKIEVSEGDRVSAGDVLIILESMKMEIPIESPQDGTVKEILVGAEESVAEDQVVAIIDN